MDAATAILSVFWPEIIVLCENVHCYNAKIHLSGKNQSYLMLTLVWTLSNLKKECSLPPWTNTQAEKGDEAEMFWTVISAWTLFLICPHILLSTEIFFYISVKVMTRSLSKSNSQSLESHSSTQTCSKQSISAHLFHGGEDLHSSGLRELSSSCTCTDLCPYCLYAHASVYMHLFSSFPIILAQLSLSGLCFPFHARPMYHIVS